jgi:hypothetical protein
MSEIRPELHLVENDLRIDVEKEFSNKVEEYVGVVAILDLFERGEITLEEAERRGYELTMSGSEAQEPVPANA